MIDVNSDRDVLARTLYGEARGEPLRGKVAVANVVMNRVESRRWFTRGPKGWDVRPHTVAATCLHAQEWNGRLVHQFSCWNSNDANRAVVENVTTADLIFRQCQLIAELAIGNMLADITEGATHYHATRIDFPRAWGDPVNPVAEHGNHKFYAGIA